MKEDLDDDAAATITDVWTAGILLAQQYIRTSLMTLIIRLLTDTTAADSAGVHLQNDNTHTSKNAHNICDSAVIASLPSFECLKPLPSAVLLPVLPNVVP